MPLTMNLINVVVVRLSGKIVMHRILDLKFSDFPAS